MGGRQSRQRIDGGGVVGLIAGSVALSLFFKTGGLVEVAAFLVVAHGIAVYLGVGGKVVVVV